MIFTDSGIDYSNGRANVDVKNGIHYGVINSNKLGEGAWDDVYANGENLDYSDAMEELKQNLSRSIKSVLEDYSSSFDADEIAESIIEDLDFDVESTGDCTRYFYKDDKVEFNVCSDGDIFVTKSKFYSLSCYCSPCAPGAGSLGSEGSVKTYCLGPDWYSKTDVPYRIFDVENGCELGQTYLMVSEHKTGSIKTMIIENEESLDLEVLIKKFLKLEYEGYLELDCVENVSGLGEYDATIKTDWNDLDSVTCWESCSFWVKAL
jgi:hypothetical protein